MQADYTYDEPSGQYYTGDPNIEENWVYSPPGEEAPIDMYNLEPDGQGGWTGYGPGEPANPDAPDFSSPNFMGMPPTQEQQDQAVYDYINQWGLGPGTAEAWEGEGGERYTKDFEGNVFDEFGNWVGNDAAQQTGLSPEAQAGLYPGAPETGAEPPPTPGTEAGGEPPPGGTDARGNVFVVGLGLVDPNKQIYFRGQRMTAMQVADIQHREYVEANERAVRGQRQVFEEGQRQFNTTEDRLREQERIRAATAERGQDISAAAARENAQLQAAVARERAANEAGLQSADLAARKEAQDKARILTLIQTLMAASRGPNGPANRAMALALMRTLGIDTGPAQTAGGGTAVNPMGIPPAQWDAMSPAAQQILLDAWMAQGGETADFEKTINDQRPRGRPSGASRPRFAALAGV